MRRQGNLHRLIITAKRDKPNLTFFFSSPSPQTSLPSTDYNKFGKARHHFIGTSHSDMTRMPLGLREAANVRFSQSEISRRLCSICSSTEPIQIFTSHSEACARMPPVPDLEGIGGERSCVRCVAPTQTPCCCDSNPLVCSRSRLPRALAKYINLPTATNSKQDFCRCCCCCCF